MFQPDKLDVELPSARPEVDETGRILLEAANLIRVRGWCKGRVEDHAGRLCIHGAIAKARTGDSSNCDGYGADELRVYNFLYSQGARGLSRAVNVDNGKLHHAFSGWNDCVERTKDEVIAALEGAAVYRS